MQKRNPIAHVYHGMFSLLFQQQPCLHSSQQSLCSPVFFNTDVKFANSVIKNRPPHKLERRLNKTWSSLLHLLTWHTHHHHQVILHQVYATRFGQSNRRCNRRTAMDANFTDLLVIVGKKCICPAGVCPRGQNPRRH